MQRRTVLALGGAAALGAAVGGVGVGAAMRDRVPSPATTPLPAPVTYEFWKQQRRAPYYIGHRGAGNVVPEHTLPSYQQALDWGAEAIEISIVRSSDNQLFCHHDLTLGRTTTGSGKISKMTAAELARVRVRVPRLGPRWVGANMPPMPLLSDVLTALGRRAVLCLEPKDDSAYDRMVAMVAEAGLTESVMIKMPGGNAARLKIAHDAGFPVYAYLGSPEVATSAGIAELARRLDPERDALVLPSRDEDKLFPAPLVRQAVDTGVPVWMVPVNRRHEVEHFARLGVQGMVSPNLGYLTGAAAPLGADTWKDGAISPGELVWDPFSDRFGLHWEVAGAIGIDVADRSSFVTLGQFCPVTAPSYRLDFEATFDPMPTDTWQHLSIAFGHADDHYYEHRAAQTDGYHAQLRADGEMALYAHVEGDPNGKPLTINRSTPPFKPGLWSRLTLDVTPQVIRFTRDDGSYVETRDDRFRGGYFHIGRSGRDGRIYIRNLSIS